jgi:chaperone required for assembly of F1-ATPase
MTSAGWAAKRFWTAASAEPTEGGFTVRLDARPVRTPSKAPLILPTRALALAIAAEWDAQTATIDPRTMPLTRAANAAIDKVTPQFAEVADVIADYGGTDLLCYRAAAPVELIARQAAAWDPLLDWAATDLDARLLATTGIVHHAQSLVALAALSRHVHDLSPFGLMALSDLVALSGSLVIGLAAIRAARTPSDLWSVSRIDEDWQAELWGADEDAAALALSKRADFLQAHHFWLLCTRD